MHDETHTAHSETLRMLRDRICYQETCYTLRNILRGTLQIRGHSVYTWRRTLTLRATLHTLGDTIHTVGDTVHPPILTLFTVLLAISWWCSLYFGCPFPALVTWFYLFYIFSLFLLFTHFKMQTYGKAKADAKKGKKTN